VTMFPYTTPNNFTDLVTDQCPLGCGNCAEIYVNSVTGHRIVCKCNKCHHCKPSKDLSKQRNTIRRDDSCKESIKVGCRSWELSLEPESDIDRSVPKIVDISSSQKARKEYTEAVSQ